MKTQEDLYLEYARCITMTRDYNEKHLTDVKPWECVRVKGNNEVFLTHPTFTLPTEDYTFALTILEGKPVFIGDKVWGLNVRQYMTVGEHDAKNIVESSCTWTPPTKKRTFMLGDKELPCPIENGNFILTVYGMGRYKFSFESEHDMRIVGDHLSDLLNEARDKE